MKLRWSQFGGQLGIGVAVIGILLVFLGWNGAASYDRLPAQFPYLISGGIAGLSLVVLGAALIIVQNQRVDRAALQTTVAELRDAIERIGGAGGSIADDPALMAAAESAGMVAAGPTTYHRPSCRLLKGRGALPTMTVADAEDRGLEPCRACDAADFGAVHEAVPTLPRRRRR